jgi:chromosome segregation ATPase
MDLKAKLKERNSQLEQQVIDLKDELDDKARDLKRARREIEKWQREAAMLKEEISIIGPSISEHTYHSPIKEKKIEAKPEMTKPRVSATKRVVGPAAAVPSKLE